MAVEQSKVLLPKSVKPLKYTLVLEPNLQTFRFKGVVTIDFDVVETTKAIKLHAESLEILK
ncbi:hypothetical protein CBR_g38105, partial [Chara braunii]